MLLLIPTKITLSLIPSMFSTPNICRRMRRYNIKIGDDFDDK